MKDLTEMGKYFGGQGSYYPRPRAFFFHYNKPASRAADEPRLTVHFDGFCFLVRGLAVNVPLKSRMSKRQPLCVMTGKATSFVSDSHGYMEIS